MKERSKIDAYGDSFCPPMDTPEQMEACKHCSLPMRMCMGLADPKKCKAAYLSPKRKGVCHDVDYAFQIRTVEEMHDAIVRPLLKHDEPEEAEYDDYVEPAPSAKTRPLKSIKGVPVVETLRRKNGVSRGTMATYLGVSLTQVGRYCTGKTGTVPMDKIQKMADYFGVGVEEIAH